MSEKELIKLNFIRTDVPDAESGNGYDYYYYTLDIMPGLSLTSVADDEVENDNWYVRNWDWPQAKIKNTESIKQLKKMVLCFQQN
jgi:hypothetical protein